MALLGWSLSASAETSAVVAVSADSASGILSRAVPLARRTVMAGDHRLTVVRIRAPRLPKLPPALQTPPSADDLATEARRAAKVAEFASLMATVYPGPVTEICWQWGERTLRAYSNIDFRLLDGLSEIETESAVLSWFCVPMEGGEEALPGALRRRLKLSSRNSEYVVDATEAEMEALPGAFAVLDAIHAYFDAHRRELIAAHAARLAAVEAREAELLAHPPIVPDTTVYLWRAEN